MSDTSDSARYLLYKPKQGFAAGFNNWISNFATLIREAAMLNRIPVLQPFNLTPQHNWGHPLQKPFGDLMSLRVDILLRDEGAVCAFTIDCLDQKDFNIEIFSENEIKHIDSKKNHIGERDNRDYPVIIRELDRLSIWRLALNNFRSDHVVIRANIEPARRIVDIAHSVIAELSGIDSLPTTDLNHQYPGTLELDRQPSPVGTYACAHIRGGDITTINPLFKAGITPRTVFKNLKRGLPRRDIPLYLMTNIQEREFFSKIKRHWPIRFADDFSQLRFFYPGCNNAGDNLSLFAIECEILKNATMRIYSHAQGQREFTLSDN